jgi:hypothetical protein
MKDWIAKNIDPPGIEKKNRGSLFLVIGKVLEKVREDAEKAFKAHFPYLADPPTLRKHGKSLSIPEFPYDSEDEFRERVSTASFFLARAGERASVHQQLQMHFGNHYTLYEKFLEVSIKILDVSEEDFIWLWNFFDEVFDPNIMFIIGEWFDFMEEVLISESQRLMIAHKERDTFDGIKYNGVIKHDGHTANTMVSIHGKYDGTFDHKSILAYNGIGKLLTKEKKLPPFKYYSGIKDRLEMHSTLDRYEEKISIGDPLAAKMRYHHLFNGVYRHDNAIKYNSSINIPLGQINGGG